MKLISNMDLVRLVTTLNYENYDLIMEFLFLYVDIKFPTELMVRVLK